MVIINGQQFTEEEFEQLKEEQLRIAEEQYKKFCDSVKCGYAIIQSTDVAFCGVDHAHIRIEPLVTCKNCVSYKEKVFEVIE